MIRLLSILIFISGSALYCQDLSYNSEEISVSEHIDGTLLTPKAIKAKSLAIIIAGSGPTDRDGNQNFLKSNSLKKLAEGLTNNSIATFRYDKRIVKQIRRGKVDDDIMFDDFVTDAKAVINHFKSDKNYSKIYVIGHSQGSLVGLLASDNNVDGFISLAGAGQNIGDVIIKQVDQTAPMFTEDTKRIINTLKEGKTTTEYPQALASIFDISVQPFMMNWMQYDPAKEIKKLNIPILLINGTKDLQVSIDEAKLLNKANENSKLKIIENMNHVLFEIKGDDLENSKSYNESFRPIVPELITSISEFIKS